MVGGPLGRYASARAVTAWQPVAVVLLALGSLAMAGAVLQKAHCLRVGWSTPDQFWHACYSDLPVLYRSSGLIDGVLPFAQGDGARPLGQPVLASGAMWLVGSVVPDGSVLARTQWYFGLWAAVLTAVLAVAVVAVVRLARRDRWSAAHLAISPVLVTTGLVSVDLLAVMLCCLGLWAWGRQRVVLAGLLMGLAVATRSYPLVVLVALGLLCLRAGAVWAWARLMAWAVAGFAVVVVPVAVSWPDAALAPYAAWWRAGAGYGSPWLVPQLLSQLRAVPLVPQLSWMRLPGFLAEPIPDGAVGALAVTGWVLALAVGAVLALSSARRPTVAELSLVMLVVVVVTGKAAPVQAALWLLPFVALTAQRWGDHLVWAGAEIVSFLAVWLYIAGLTNADRGLPPHVYAMLLSVRLGTLVYLAVLTWQRARRRPVVGGEEQAEELDDAAGPLAGQPDRLLVRFT
ncbi:MAG TPA: glycosyltransferase 87 family protein [Dermatophilaceae bacterium]|nr:glycosyltransferase 87 family protein [Dermatophilaceae bacterium]